MHKNICACQESQFILSKIRGVYFMNKTGLKTFVCSFVFTLSAIIGTDRAFFYTPDTTEENLKIPRKNITLFFSRPHPQTFSSQTEPVQKVALETPDFEPEELKIAQNMPVLPQGYAVTDIPELAEKVKIPLVLEDIAPPTEVVAEEKSKEDKLPDVPLIYAGLESSTESLSGAQKEMPASQEVPEISEPPVKLASVEPPVSDETSISISQPVIVKANKQIIKIDNLKKREERLKQKEKQDVTLASAEEVIPLQNSKELSAEKEQQENRPSSSQVASLGENMPLNAAEAVVVEETKGMREWQTMSEKHHDDNPWVVARGSKYIKNKQLLKEDFASDAAEKKAELLLSRKNSDKEKSAKVAVQDNLLIPIPQELLDEDNLVPDVSDDDGKKTRRPKPVAKKKEKEKESSFLDNITSVFSKENRERAIRNLKEKSSKLMGDEDNEKEEIRPQILPTEIRLSFQPGRAEISGQTLRWIQAFARKAADEDDVGLEIRIDGSKSFELQQKRLNLLYNILTANNVPYPKIKAVFVDRVPNSFVVRTVKIVMGNKSSKEKDDWKKYYQKW